MATSEHSNEHSKPERLYENGNHVIMRCPECNCVQLTYGTSHFLLNWKQFEHLYRKLKTEALRIADFPQDYKCFSVPVEHHVARLFLNPAELEELMEMMTQAMLMSSVKNILRD